MTTSKQKPDGYVAWHPEKGFDTETFAHASLGERPSDALSRIHGSAKYACQAALNEGWRIRPVKLVFLDEKEK